MFFFNKYLTFFIVIYNITIKYKRIIKVNKNFISTIKSINKDYWHSLVPVEKNSKKPKSLFDKEGNSYNWTEFSLLFKEKTESDVLSLCQDNYGIKPFKNIIIIDVDNKDKTKEGSKSIKKFFNFLGIDEYFLDCYLTETANNGFHFYIEIENKEKFNLPNKKSLKDYPSIEFIMGDNSKVMCPGSIIDNKEYKFNGKYEIINLDNKQVRLFRDMVEYKKTNNENNKNEILDINNDHLKYLNNWLSKQDAKDYNNWLSVSFRVAGLILNSRYVGTSPINHIEAIKIIYTEWSISTENPLHSIKKAEKQLEDCMRDFDGSRTDYKSIIGYFDKKETKNQKQKTSSYEEYETKEEYEKENPKSKEKPTFIYDEKIAHEIFGKIASDNLYMIPIQTSGLNNDFSYYYKYKDGGIEEFPKIERAFMFLYENKIIDISYYDKLNDFIEGNPDKEKQIEFINKIKTKSIGLLYKYYKKVEGTIALPHYPDIVYLDSNGKLHKKFSKKFKKVKKLLNVSYEKPDFDTSEIKTLEEKNNFFDRIDKLFYANCSNSEEEVEFIKKIFYINIFKPELKLGFTPVFTGVGSTGKTTLIKLLRLILGDAFTTERGNSITGNFDPPSYETSKLIYMEDVPKLNEKETNNLKPLFGENKVKIRRMYRESKEIYRNFNLIFTSNIPNPFHNTKGERRFYYLRCLETIGIDDDWLKEMNIDIENNVALIYEYFQTRVKFCEQNDKYLHLSPKKSETQKAYIESERQGKYTYIDLYEDVLKDYKIDNCIEIPFSMYEFREKLKKIIDKDEDNNFSKNEIVRIMKISTLNSFFREEMFVLSSKKFRKNGKLNKVFYKVPIKEQKELDNILSNII